MTRRLAQRLAPFALAVLVTACLLQTTAAAWHQVDCHDAVCYACLHADNNAWAAQSGSVEVATGPIGECATQRPAQDVPVIVVRSAFARAPPST